MMRWVSARARYRTSSPSSTPTNRIHGIDHEADLGGLSHGGKRFAGQIGLTQVENLGVNRNTCSSCEAYPSLAKVARQRRTDRD